MIQGENETATARGAGIEIVRMPAELDLTTSEGVVAQGCAAMARPVRLLLLDLTGLSFCDARGLSAFVRIANHADAAGCGFGLIAPRPPVAKILRLSDLDSRMPVFATVDDARALLMAMASLPRRLPFGHRRALTDPRSHGLSLQAPARMIASTALPAADNAHAVGDLSRERAVTESVPSGSLRAPESPRDT